MWLILGPFSFRELYSVRSVTNFMLFDAWWVKYTEFLGPIILGTTEKQGETDLKPWRVTVSDFTDTDITTPPPTLKKDV